MGSTERNMSSFSFKGSELPMLITTIYALTPKGRTVYVISPWINVHIKLVTPWNLKSRPYFIDFIKSERDRGIDSKFFISTKGENEPETQLSLKTLSSERFQVEIVKELHAKAIIGASLMYEGSANITYSGLYNNRESISVSRVEKQDTELLRIFS